jgi:hypothetical protein
VFEGRDGLLHRRARQPEERGATLVEFAFVLPLFILLLFAIIDFGWIFTQFLDVKQGAREGARLAVVNDCVGSGSTCRDDIAQKVCDRTQDLDNDAEDVTFGINGDIAEVTLQYPARSLTGMMSAFINGDLTSKVHMRVEKPPAWSTGTFSCP